MESTTCKADSLKPLVLKAGVPLVLSVAGFFCARIISRRRMKIVNHNSSSLENQSCFGDELNDHEVVSTSSRLEEDSDHMEVTPGFLDPVGSSVFLCKLRIEEEMLGLRRRIQEVQSRESELERKFICYQALKEEEFVLGEMKNMLLLEKVRVEFLDKEISSMEAEKQRFEELVLVVLSVVEQIELVKMENRLLKRKVRKFSRKTRDLSGVIKEKDLKIKSAEAQILECRKELDSQSDVATKLEAEVAESKAIANKLQQEKDQLMIKLNAAENSAATVSQTETGVTTENYKQLLNELENLQKDRAAETAEIIHLRWTNACLRYELMRSHVDQQHLENERRNHLELELEENNLTGNFSLESQKEASELAQEGTSSHHQSCSRKKKFLHKLKRWVEGNESMKTKLDCKESQENKCLGRHSVCEEAGEEAAFVDARRSCSSA